MLWGSEQCTYEVWGYPALFIQTLLFFFKLSVKASPGGGNVWKALITDGSGKQMFCWRSSQDAGTLFNLVQSSAENFKYSCSCCWKRRTPLTLCPLRSDLYFVPRSCDASEASSYIFQSRHKQTSSPYSCFNLLPVACCVFPVCVSESNRV